MVPFFPFFFSKKTIFFFTFWPVFGPKIGTKKRPKNRGHKNCNFGSDIVFFLLMRDWAQFWVPIFGTIFGSNFGNQVLNHWFNFSQILDSILPNFWFHFFPHFGSIFGDVLGNIFEAFLVHFLKRFTYRKTRFLYLKNGNLFFEFLAEFDPCCCTLQHHAYSPFCNEIDIVCISWHCCSPGELQR